MPDIKNFRMEFTPASSAAGISPEWLAAALENVGVSPRQPRRLQKVAIGGSRIALIKLVSHSRHRFEPWSSLNFFPRLKPRFAQREGENYQLFAAAGIATPKLYAFGEEWQSGIRNRGVIVVEWLERPTLQAQLEASDTIQAQLLANCWLAMLANIHRRGLVHGDADSDNFLLGDNGELIAIDLEKSKPLTAKTQQKELLRAERCLREHGMSEDSISIALAEYHRTAQAD